MKEFWNALDEIDEKTWVLEPENPTRSATMRRIAVGERNGKENKLGFGLQPNGDQNSKMFKMMSFHLKNPTHYFKQHM